MKKRVKLKNRKLSEPGNYVEAIASNPNSMVIGCWEVLGSFYWSKCIVDLTAVDSDDDSYNVSSLLVVHLM